MCGADEPENGAEGAPCSSSAVLEKRIEEITLSRSLLVSRERKCLGAKP